MDLYYICPTNLIGYIVYKFNRMKIRHILILLLIFTSQPGKTQDQYALDNTKSSIKITGTSNVHDWEMQASGISANMTLDQDVQNLNKITALYISLPAQNIKSHNSIMDKKTWEAIKTDTYKTIEFKLGSIINLNKSGPKISGIAKGTLTIAGKSNNYAIPFSGNTLDNDQIIFSGSKEIRLPDFNITPPTAMMGTLKTGETINIIFNLQFNATPSNS